MDCGIPFCHQGCPLGNLIPDWNDLVYRDQWRMALDRLHATNNFPEFTGKLCPAPCEASCVLGINDDPVTIKQIEASIIDRAWNEGWVVPQPAQGAHRKDRRGGRLWPGRAWPAPSNWLARGIRSRSSSGPTASAACSATEFPTSRWRSGSSTAGSPRWRPRESIFKPSTNIGVDVPAERLLAEFDAICLCGGSTVPRDLPIEGRDLKGIYFAMDFLTLQNRRVAGDSNHGELHSAKDKDVIIIGGGDTGADCLGTVHRHGCKSVHQFEIVPRPPDSREPANPWPQWSNVFRVSSAHEEGGIREYSINTRRFVGHEGRRRGPSRPFACEMKIERRPAQVRRDSRNREHLSGGPRPPGDGFPRPREEGMLEQFGVELDPMGNVKADADKRTSVEKVFTAGDMTRGQSLIVWAIAEGRHAARSIDEFLMGDHRNSPRRWSTATTSALCLIPPRLLRTVISPPSPADRLSIALLSHDSETHRIGSDTRPPAFKRHLMIDFELSSHNNFGCPKFSYCGAASNRLLSCSKSGC